MRSSEFSRREGERCDVDVPTDLDALPDTGGSPEAPALDMTRAIPPRARRERGFTLIEVLVALAIIAVAMAAALRATGVMTANNRALQDKTLALLAAQNALTQLRLEQSLPRAGSQTVPCPQGGRALQCELVFTNSMNRSFRQVSVNVHDAASARPDAVLLQLDGLLSSLR